MFVDFNILNQLGSPSINSNTYANRPSAGQTGRLFVSTDTYEIYRDNGTTWDLIGGPGSSTITGSGTATQVAYFTSTSAIGSSANLFWDNTNTRLGVGTATPGAALDVHSTGTIAQLNSTGATNNGYLAFQRAGTTTFSIGDTYNAGSNYFRIFGNTLSADIVQIFASTGKTTFQATETYTTGLARANYFDYNLSVSAGGSFSSPNAITALGASLDLTLAGSATIPSGARSGLDAYNSVSFTGTGTLTHTQGTQIRAYSNLTAGWAFNGSATGTITHLAGLRVLFPDNTGSAVTVTNNYALLLNDQTANTGTVTYTNRWGVYQEGTSDTNYFAATTLIGTTVNSGYKFEVSGSANATTLYQNGVQVLTTAAISGTTNYIPKFTSTSAIGNSNLQTDASGNLGLGVSPSAWSLGTAIDINGGPAILGINNGTQITNNAYYNGGWKYKATSYAQNLVLDNDGSFKFNQAASGTAGNAISFTQAMTLFSTGNLAVGGTSDNGYRLDVTGTSRFTSTLTAGGQFISGMGNNSQIFLSNSATTGYQYATISNSGANLTLGIERSTGGSLSNGSLAYASLLQTANATALQFGTNNTIRATLDASGNVGIGTTSPSYALQVTASSPTIAINSNNQSASSVSTLLFRNADGNGNTYDIASIDGLTGGNGGYGNLVFKTGFNTTNSERMRITSGGELLINTTSDAGDYKLQVAGNSYVTGKLDIYNDIRIITDQTGAFRANYQTSSNNYAALFKWNAIQFGNDGDNYIIGGNTVTGGNLSFYVNSSALYSSGTPSGTLALKLTSSANAEFGGSIKTAAPSGGTAKPYKLGEAGVAIGGSDGYAVKVEIDGTLYYLMTGYLP